MKRWLMRTSGWRSRLCSSAAALRSAVVVRSAVIVPGAVVARSAVIVRSAAPGFVAAGLLVAAGPLSAQRDASTEAPRPVTPQDYGRFEATGAGLLSSDGRWLAFGVTRVNEQNELRVRLVGRDSTVIIPHGHAPAFSGDGRWLAYAIGVAPSERERLTNENKPIRDRAAVLELRTGNTVAMGEVSAFRFSPDGGYLALHGYAADSARGSDLIVRDLEGGTNVSFGNVSSFEWAPAGSLLAITLDTETGAGNAVQLYDAANGALRVLDSSRYRYTGLAWRADARDLAVLQAEPDSLYRDTAHVALAWTNVNTARAVRYELRAGKTAGFPANTRIVGSFTPEWSRDGSMIVIGLRPWFQSRRMVDRAPSDSSDALQPAANDPASGEKPSDVQIWHGADVRIMPQQKAQEQQDLRRTLLAVWHAGGDRLVQVGTELHESAELLADDRHGIETDRSRHAFGAMFGRPGVDVWLIDVRSGDRERVLENVQVFMGPSTTGRYLLWFHDGDYWAYDIGARRRTNLTAGLGGSFADTEHDYPVDALPPYGIAGWSSDDTAVLVYDRYDVWSISPDGMSGRRVTEGAADRVIHRVAALDRDAEGIDLARPLYFTLHGERTKQSGWARMRPGNQAERLLLEDARLWRLMRADSTDTFAYTRERFDDAPDWFVGNADLRGARQVSRLNPFQHEYAWGRSELVDFTSATGTSLQAALLYPADYDPARKYPMIVYTYERVSQNLHNYIVPSERSYYNFSVFTAQGYFVLMPDIVYRARDPGVSALEAVVPAVQTILDRGLVDPERIGLIGHSWGGYQAAYVPTRTNIFAAAVAGAPITNFLSFAGAIHWTPGVAEFSHWETGQARMGVPYWEDLDAYLRNSPAHFVHELDTPMLMMFGDADGTVDWHQGVEFYNFARRAGRTDFVMLVYPGEDHALRERENQIDYHRRILQWFGYWLKGEPPARWITEGTTWLERREILNER